VVVNAVVIETDDDLRAYFWEKVIHGEGAFVVTASGFDQYAARIRRKLIREATDQIGGLSPTWDGGSGTR
jgi:Ca-activated chloride channel homolog